MLPLSGVTPINPAAWLLGSLSLWERAGVRESVAQRYHAGFNSKPPGNHSPDLVGARCNVPLRAMVLEECWIPVFAGMTSCEY